MTRTQVRTTGFVLVAIIIAAVLSLVGTFRDGQKIGRLHVALAAERSAHDTTRTHLAELCADTAKMRRTLTQLIDAGEIPEKAFRVMAVFSASQRHCTAEVAP